MTTLKPAFSPNAETVLEKRYLLPGEDPEAMLRRVSFGNTEYYDLMASLDFLPNSPTLFNAGTGMGTLSACFKFDVEDSMDGIMEVARKAALVQKWGGGVGYALSALRPKGSPVSTTHKNAGGPVQFLKLYHAVAEAITQGGKRDGAQMGILHCDHPDIHEFIHCKDNDPQRLSTFNISVACTDTWMKEQVSLGHEGLLWEMAQSAWRTGDPGCYFIDEAERHNPTPWIGQLTGTNPCGEVPLLDNEPCNLGSLNLSHFVRTPSSLGRNGTYKPEIQWEELEEATRLATRFLDDILDHNQFPDPAITNAALVTRKLGLGVMGWADMLALLHIPYDSDEAVELGSEVMEKINSWAKDESRSLSETKGPAPCFDISNGAPYHTSLRNATRTCIAPTGTISILADASSGIEPHFALEWVRTMGDGTPLKERIAILDRTNGFVPKTSMEIDWHWHIRHQAAFQKNTDLAVSKTINMANAVTVQDIFDAYAMMWETGCKGGTIYRDGSRDTQVLSTTTKAPEVIIADTPRRRRLPVTRKSITHKFTVGGQEGYITVGLYEDGTPGELFIKSSKEGATLSALLDAVGVETSIALQHGVPLETLSSKFRNTHYEPAGFTDNKEIPVATSLLDYIFHWMEHEFIPGEKGKLTYETPELGKAVSSGITCPDCGMPVMTLEGCLVCRCGWSRC